MKLAIVTQAYLPLISGTTNVLQEYCRILKKKHKLDITIFTPNFFNGKKEEVINGVKVRRFPYINLGRNYGVSIPLLVSLMRENFDLIHSHGFGYFPATAGWIASKIKKTPHIFTLHVHPPVYTPLRTLLFWIYYITQGVYILKNSDIVLPITKVEKKLIIDMGGSKINMEILPHPIRTDVFKPTTKLPKHNVNGKVVLRVEPFKKERGFIEAIKIAKDVTKKRSDTKFVFIGSGDLGEKAKEIVRGCRNIIFLNRTPLKELIRWYSRADVLMLISKYEAFSLMSAESMACGTPVVATNVGGISEVVKDKKTGFLITYGDWTKFEEKIIELIDNNKKRILFSKKGIKHVRKNFDSEIVVQKLFNIYKKAIANKRNVYKQN